MLLRTCACTHCLRSLFRAAALTFCDHRYCGLSSDLVTAHTEVVVDESVVLAMNARHVDHPRRFALDACRGVRTQSRDACEKFVVQDIVSNFKYISALPLEKRVRGRSPLLCVERGNRNWGVRASCRTRSQHGSAPSSALRSVFCWRTILVERSAMAKMFHTFRASQCQRRKSCLLQCLERGFVSLRSSCTTRLTSRVNICRRCCIILRQCKSKGTQFLLAMSLIRDSKQVTGGLVPQICGDRLDSCHRGSARCWGSVPQPSHPTPQV